MLVSAAVIAVAALAYALLRPTPRAAEPITLSALLPEGVELGRDSIETAISPDGRRVAVAAADASGVSKIWIRDLARSEVRALAGTEGAMQPFWSPDGARLGFFARKSVDYRISFAPAMFGQKSASPSTPS